jgi:hypothetical protein
MDILDKLVQASSTSKDLDLFLKNNNNSIELYDFFMTQPFKILYKYNDRIESYILPQYSIYAELNFNDSTNESFILTLLDVSERFGFLTEFEQLYQLIERYNIDRSSRLEAAALYLIDIRNIDDYTDRIERVLELLINGYLNEEDTEHNIIRTLINFYAQVFNNFGSHNQNGFFNFKNIFSLMLNKEEYNSLFSDTVITIFQLDISDTASTYTNIQIILDELSNRTKRYFPFNTHLLIIENDTEYSRILTSSQNDFFSLRQISVDLYGKVKSDKIFYSLQRGVQVLTEPNQLIAYLNSFGNMHYSKIDSALGAFQDDILNKIDEIYDWGCGQGLASYILSEKYPKINAKISLIEPSEIALKRAALHLKKLGNQNIVTINKDLDSLLIKDFSSSGNLLKVHLFSNILDIDLFSMPQLIQLIKKSFSGINYFICVSPYVNVVKTSRLNNFMEAFENSENFQILESIEEPKGFWSGTNWSRVIKVFQVNL